MRFHLKNNLNTKMKLYTTGEFISNYISFEKKKISPQKRNFAQLVNI